MSTSTHTPDVFETYFANPTLENRQAAEDRARELWKRPALDNLSLAKHNLEHAVGDLGQASGACAAMAGPGTELARMSAHLQNLQSQVGYQLKRVSTLLSLEPDAYEYKASLPTKWELIVYRPLDNGSGDLTGKTMGTYDTEYAAFQALNAAIATMRYLDRSLTQEPAGGPDTNSWKLMRGTERVCEFQVHSIAANGFARIV